MTFDVIVIGGGPAGYEAAVRGAQLGLKVALVEKHKRLGGTCLNVGCIPSKALLESSEHFAQARHHLEQHGVRVGDVTLDVATMMRRKEEVVETLTDGIAALMKRHKIHVVTGAGKPLGDGRVRVDSAEGASELASRHIVLACGSDPVSLPFLPFDANRVVSSTEALSFDSPPKRLAVIGGGAIGLELSSVWSRLGSQVTVVEMMPQVVPTADRQMAKLLAEALTAQGLAIRVGTKVESAQHKDDGVELVLVSEKGEREALTYDKVLVAVGRRSVAPRLGLEELGVTLDRAGRVVVDARFETTAPGIFAVGDLIEGPMLAHKASQEGERVMEIISGHAPSPKPVNIPAVVYSSPELASVGATEEELKDLKAPFKAGRSYFQANGRALASGRAEGVCKVLAHKEDGTILGVHILGPQASELIGQAVVAMGLRAKVKDLGAMIQAHPTLTEAMKEAALAAS